MFQMSQIVLERFNVKETLANKTSVLTWVLLTFLFKYLPFIYRYAILFILPIKVLLISLQHHAIKMMFICYIPVHELLIFKKFLTVAFILQIENNLQVINNSCKRSASELSKLWFLNMSYDISLSKFWAAKCGISFRMQFK